MQRCHSLFLGVLAGSFLLHAPAALAANSGYKMVYTFCTQTNCADGAFPTGNLINVSGVLYGTTNEGGQSLEGTVFSLDPGTGTETVLYSFSNKLGQDGERPSGGLTAVKGKFYGTTAEGGAYPYAGTVFSLDPKSGAETVLYSFQGGTDGVSPTGSLVEVNGILYGTTVAGGGGPCTSNGDGCGVVFAFDPAKAKETVVHAFTGTDGDAPNGNLINVNGLLYGTTYQGGANVCETQFPYYNCGVVFSVDPASGKENVVHSFQNDGQDGDFPAAGLLEANGTLYGTTAGGGAGCNGGCGTLFSIDPSTGAESVLYSFCGVTGCLWGPSGGVTIVKSIFYGTAAGGGRDCHVQRYDAQRCGGAFSFDPTTGIWTALHVFNGLTDGSDPLQALIDVKGTLYGTTFEGGAGGICSPQHNSKAGCGTIFSIKN
jgi:uncharacterized repeat protein (TIGR03803 family)